MRTRVVLLLALALVWCAGAAHAQQMQSQPLTFVSDYYVHPGKEDDFMTLVKTVGQPVRDKLMADRVIFGWGIEVPVLRAPGNPTHSIWYSVADWAGVQKVQAAMAAQLAKLAEEDKKAADDARKKGGKALKSTAERIQETFDMSKTKDWVFRDVEAFHTNTPPPAGALPYTWFAMDRVDPGKSREYRELFDKYDKPVLDKLVADGIVWAYGLGVQEVTSTNEFTHYFWASVADLGAFDKINAAFEADRARRSPEERSVIQQNYHKLTDPAAYRDFILRSIIFKIGGPPPKK